MNILKEQKCAYISCSLRLYQNVSYFHSKLLALLDLLFTIRCQKRFECQKVWAKNISSYKAQKGYMAIQRSHILEVCRKRHFCN